MHCLIWGVHIPNQGSAPGLAWSEEGLQGLNSRLDFNAEQDTQS